MPALTVLAIVAGSVAAYLADGFRSTRMDLNDAGVWVINTQRGLIGRINTQTFAIEVSVSPEDSSFDVAQLDSTVVLEQRDSASLAVVDPALAELHDKRKSGGAEVHLGGDTAALSARRDGKVWVTPLDKVGAFEPNAVPAVEDAGEADTAGTATAVSEGGTVHSYSAGSAERHVVADGEARTEPVPGPLAEPEITTVGEELVLLDRSTGRLVLPSGQVVDLGAQSAPRVQIPGPSDDEVLVATDDALVAITLADGARRTVFGEGTRGAVNPVSLGGCAYGAWATTPKFAQICPGRDPQVRTPAKVPRGTKSLRFRVNHNRVVLNDGATGWNVVFTEREPQEVDNWDEALKKGDQDKPNERVVQKKNDECKREGAGGAELSDDSRGARPGTPVVVRVLLNDRVSTCEVPYLTVPQPPTPDIADVAVVEQGTAIQVTPNPRLEPGRTIRFRYQVEIAGAKEQATVTVSIVDPASNRPPETEDDDTAVAAGKSVRHNVLTNDHDPDGDALTLVAVQAREGGIATYRADGTISYTAPGGVEGQKTVAYTVADELGLKSEGTLRVGIFREDQPVQPTARHDRADVKVAERKRVDVLANDSDPNDDLLTVTDATSTTADLEVQREPDNTLTVIARRPGVFTVDYAISDGELTDRAKLLVVASEPGTNRPPVAVRDDVAARPGVRADVDLLANDFDPDGDMLAVTSITVPPEAAGLSVQPVNMRYAIVTAPAGFSGKSVAVRYSVTDGIATVEGVLVVRPFLDGHVDQPPVVADDEASVRAGNIIAIDVLANDTDPEGERITIVGVSDPGEGKGRAFVEGDQLRYEAPATGPLTVHLTYTVEDPGKNKVDGIVTVRVLAPDATNRPPAGPVVEARVLAGDVVPIPVPLLGLDPDGDVVTVVSVSETEGRQPTKGVATPTATGLSYQSFRGAAGTDVFEFLVRDAGGLDAVGQARVVVVPRQTLNSPPVAAPDKVSVKPGASATVAVLANDRDADRDPLSLLTGGEDAPTQPAGGSARVDGSGIVVTMDPGAAPGDVSFSYTVTDGRGGRARGVVTVTVSAQPTPEKPIARDDLLSPKAPGETVEVPVLDNDVDPDGDKARLRVQVLTTGVNASVQPDGKIRVQLGDRSLAFTYSVTDPDNQTASAVVVIPVMADRPPECRAQAFDANAGEPLTVDVLAGCSDPDGKGLSLVRVANATRGTARIDGGNVVFEADGGAPGDGGFTAVVSDGTMSTVAGVVVRVNGDNVPPAFTNTNVELPAGGELRVDLQSLVTDLNPGDRHTFDDLDGTTPQVSASIEGSVLVVHAAPDARDARATLTLKVSDGRAGTTGQVGVHVLKYAGAPPMAVDDSAKTIQGEAKELDVVANDVDPAGRGLTIESVSVASANTGTATKLDNRRIRYSPNPDFFGEALITYRIMDASRDPERSSSATVRINVVGRPSAPTAPTGIRESRRVILTWGAAQPNGGPITEYVIENNRGAGGQRRTASTSYTFDGLTNGTPYQFRVAAINEAVRPGQEVWSAWSAPITPDVVPGTPASPTLRFGNGFIDVTWSPPANEGSPITSYDVRISGGSQSGSRQVEGTTTYRWTGLANGSQYSFSVRANNGAGNGEWSVATNDPVNGVPAGPPGGVPNITAQAGDGTVSVSWGLPNANGDAKLTYQVSVNPADAAARTITSGDRSTTFSGLRNGTAYTITVVASNKAGPGPAASASFTPFGVPSTPTGLRGTVNGTNVTWTWNASDGNGRAITRYELTIDGSTRNVSGTSYTSSLSEGQHSAYVVAVNAGNLKSRPSSTATATVEPQTFVLRTHNNGEWKSHFGNPVGARDESVDTVAPGATLHIICKRFIDPDIVSNRTSGTGGWWYQIEEYQNNRPWMPSTNFSANPSTVTRTC